MATTQTQREQIVLTARKNPKLKHREIADMHSVSLNTASNIIGRAKRHLGDKFYFEGKKRTTNTSMVLDILENSPRVAVWSSVIEKKTKLTDEQVRSAANHIRNTMGLDVTRHVVESDGRVMYLYQPKDNKEAQKLRFVDVFTLMNRLEAA
ncbi:hypothetical protein L1D52_23970 [Vibrio brasiliensis]|uniref:hypothetical protein n=1 Tax=Vibrio brasiliensis TaxID=170652 RepID=UPI001EFEAC0C|nr:hypothetical protein [Vibrio brasiliensis]MCG9785369.1 hypothetical protein [Vibrio brasiliensis]